MRTRIGILIAAAAVVGLALPGVVSAASVQVVVGREIAGHGTLLVAASNQMTVYTFDKDVAGSGVSNCTGTCLTIWPALTISAGDTPTGGTGVTGVLATIVRADDGATQVTYDGKPLYFFAHDTAPGDANGIYPNWRAIVLAAPAASSTPAPTTAPTATPMAAPASGAVLAAGATPPPTDKTAPAAGSTVDGLGLLALAGLAFLVALGLVARRLGLGRVRVD